MKAISLEKLKENFGDLLEQGAPLAKYTTTRVGGTADALITVTSADQLADAATYLWKENIPFILLGGGANSLVSDKGVREVVILNRAKQLDIFEKDGHYFVRAESGEFTTVVSRKVSSQGFSGLEWAGGIPGTIGGAVVGNAGAHGGDTAGTLEMAEILHRFNGRQVWEPADLNYAYRQSRLKVEKPEAIVLAAIYRIIPDDPGAIQSRLEEYLADRKRRQPQGPSMGSTFRNPPGDYAGRLIEAAGLKGTRVGGVQISEKHGNFFLNDGTGTASDYDALIQLVKKNVMEQFGIKLECEIFYVGDWPEDCNSAYDRSAGANK